LTASGGAKTDSEIAAIPKWVREQSRQRHSQLGAEEEISGSEKVAEVAWKEKLLPALLSMPSDGFERLCQRVLREACFAKVEVTGGDLVSRTVKFRRVRTMLSTDAAGLSSIDTQECYSEASRRNVKYLIYKGLAPSEEFPATRERWATKDGGRRQVGPLGALGAPSKRRILPPTGLGWAADLAECGRAGINALLESALGRTGQGHSSGTRRRRRYGEATEIHPES
jgi:hypothetical protein